MNLIVRPYSATLSLFCRWSATGILATLLVVSPLLYGSTSPWAFIWTERAIFALAILFAASIALEGDYTGSNASYLPNPIIPLILLCAVVAFQQITLPPVLLRVFSPGAYTLYSSTLPGWPTSLPYRHLESVAPDFLAHGSTWRPLAIDRTVTSIGFAKLCAYTILLWVVCCYPSKEPGRQDGFMRFMLFSVLMSGLVVAIIGFLGLSHASADARMSGPFVNADHFANYLAMILPIALIGLFFPQSFSAGPRRAVCRGVCFALTVAISIPVMMSQSRAGWADLVIGSGFAMSMSSSAIGWPQWPQFFARHLSRPHPMGTALAVMVALSLSCVLLISSPEQSTIGVRVAQSVTEGDYLSSRAAVWRDSLAMIRDFPLFGVGLGNWPELFPHYQRPPWNCFLFWREAHNDYVQGAAELGLVGLGLLGWLVVQQSSQFYRGFRTIPTPFLPIYVALLSGLAAFAFHEFFDFSLQVPANAMLFVVLGGLALRIAGRGDTGVQLPVSWSNPRLVAVGVASICVLLVAFATSQPNLPFPYFLNEKLSAVARMGRPAAVELAARLASDHPAYAASHLTLFNSVRDTADSEFADQELRSAIWLDPNDPGTNDLYADALERDNHHHEALAQIRRSVMLSPQLQSHFYLQDRNIDGLTQDEKGAVEDGLKLALARGYTGAIDDLAGYYDLTARYMEKAEVYSAAANGEHEFNQQERLLLAAAEAFAKANDRSSAEKMLHRACDKGPGLPLPYVKLIEVVYGPERDMRSARSTVDAGIRNGADPMPLLSALAQAARSINDSTVAEQALKQIVQYAPTFQNTLRLGQFYLDSGNPDGAVEAMREATLIEPQRALGYAYLAEAEKAAYQYAAASRDYSRALELDPANREVQTRYSDFRKMIDGYNGQ